MGVGLVRHRVAVLASAESMARGWKGGDAWFFGGVTDACSRISGHYMSLAEGANVR